MHTLDNYKIKMSAEFVSMQAWLLECFSEEYDREEINKLDAADLVNAINDYYEGEAEQFMHDRATEAQ